MRTGLYGWSLGLAGDLAQTRWLLIEQAGSTIAMPFLIALMFWLSVIGLLPQSIHCVTGPAACR